MYTLGIPRSTSASVQCREEKKIHLRGTLSGTFWYNKLVISQMKKEGWNTIVDYFPKQPEELEHRSAGTGERLKVVCCGCFENKGNRHKC